MLDGTMVLVLAAAALAWFWWKSKGIKDRAVLVSKRHCQQSGVQMLDGSVVLRALWFKRDTEERIRLWRRYVFEFSSTGEQRYRGQIVMLGDQVELVDMEPYRTH